MAQHLDSGPSSRSLALESVEYMFIRLLALVVGGQSSQAAEIRPTLATTATLTNQQRFDAASTALEAGHCTQAVSAFDALQTTAEAKRNAVQALLYIFDDDGVCGSFPRVEGVAAIKRAIPASEARGESFAGDVSAARGGDLATERLEYR